MTELARPDLRFHASWAAAVREFEAAGDVMHGSGLWQFDTSDLSAAALAPEVDRLLAEGNPATALPADRVHSSNFWIVDGDEFLGYLAVRHALTPYLLEEGGHIGYSVRPSRRREGHATRALLLALDEARSLGLDRALVTCDYDNAPSRLTIEHAGGVLEDRRGDKLRYWFDLAR
jgi:predicted acetyltransferase